MEMRLFSAEIQAGDFRSVVGQEALTTTLKKSLSWNSSLQCLPLLWSRV
jgi:hypothetical protein